MAGLSGGTPTESTGRAATRERAQMLLIGAFVLAVMFVALALVVNSAIFTENLASRNHAGGANDALQARHTIETGLGDAMGEANVHNNSGWATLTHNVSKANETITDIVGREYAANGRFVSARVLNHERGTRIADNASGGSTFEGSSGADNWTVAETSATRAFVMDIDYNDLSGDNNFGGTVTDEFYVRIVDGSDTWRVNVTDRSGDFAVGVRAPSGDEGVCSVSGSPDHVEVDLTRGTVAGRDCPALDFWQTVGSHDVKFNESNFVHGNYSLVVDANGYLNAELQSGPGAGLAPYTDLAVYSTTLRYRYDAPTVSYETDVRVAPGEPE